jgi:hypothetical protein
MCSVVATKTESGPSRFIENLPTPQKNKRFLKLFLSMYIIVWRPKHCTSEMSRLLSSLVTLGSAIASSELCGQGTSYVPTTRNYCIQVMDVDWNYAPLYGQNGEDNHGGQEEEGDGTCDICTEFYDYSNYQLNRDPPKMAHYIMKGLLREFNYENGACNWDSIKEVDPRNGFNGPVIRAVTGDTVKVHFYNNAYTVYEDDTNDGDDDNTIQESAIFNLFPKGLVAATVCVSFCML